MKRYFYLLLVLFSCLCFGRVVSAVDYDIESYQGDLVLREDNTATYTEKVTYKFNDDYNGQIVSLGSAGKMPNGFAIDGNPTVSVLTNGEPDMDINPQVKDLGDGYEVKIYNSGNDGDRVVVTVTWQLRNLLFLHRDIAELNWTPISDWDQGIGEVVLTVSGLSNPDKSELFAHSGYFGTQPFVDKDGTDYLVKLNGIGSGDNVELHGYWDRQTVSLVSQNEDESDYLPTFKAQEEKIARKTVFYRQLGEIYMPLLLLCAILVAAILYFVFTQKIKPKQSYPKNARLYEAPQDLAPLVLAENIYAVDMEDVDPTRGGKAALNFENMVQATLLDLLDRGNLLLQGDAENPVLQIATYDGLADFERRFLGMAFNKQSQASVKDLFSAYQISEDIYKHKSSADESYIRNIGSNIKSLFTNSLRSLSKEVRSEGKRLGLFGHYRPLKVQEKRLLITAIILASAVLLFSLGFLFVYLGAFGGFIWIYIPLALVGLVMICIFASKAQLYWRDGVLNDEGAHDFYLWRSFSNMLRDIAHLDKTEIEGIILWNRLLVYATLFGYADRVSRVMALRQIHLGNPSMDSYVQDNLHYAFYSSMHSFSNYGHVATTASNFSVSSGGSSGGGFSGGGGGGGGGAF